MAKYVGALFILLVLAGPCLGRKEETLQELMARADAASLSQQPDLYMEVADRELKAAIDAYKAGKYDDFHADLDQIVKSSDRAHAAAIQSKKHVKRTEIRIRRISGRLRDVKTDVEFDEQAGVQSTIDRLEDFRTELLKSMFGTKSDD